MHTTLACNCTQTPVLTASKKPSCVKGERSADVYHATMQPVAGIPKNIAESASPTLILPALHVAASAPLRERAIAVVHRHQALGKPRDVLRGALGAPGALHASTVYYLPFGRTFAMSGG